ncbi:uncharacterized protein LOC128274497 [Anopheles cruzii]|uniref:uncharacterized protein LOC128274497 n=1 Tax=Anopheles cruzii TaxID=68878 RepID=UPI0022EC7F71|nr:uncharacterized protein LOC128274497 [Anopheles cruzii]
MHMKGLTLSAILEQGTTRRRKSPPKEECPKKQKRDSWRKIAAILNKCESKRSHEEIRLLEKEPEVVKQVLARRKRNVEYKERALETEDEPEVIERKALKLAQAIAKANHVIVYTGAGISTSAKIPDYRGSQGIWTLLEQGKDIGEYDLSLADPTFTHMALFELHQRGMLKHVLSQNCDGLHLRSGLSRFSLSEVHGNMYVEVCKQCKPNVEYWRLFDTTQFTARHYHKTNRRCRRCGGPLIDTIVHFGERGQLKWPLNWAGITAHTEKTDLILCIGSSLKVLRKYTWLWATDRPIKKRPKIFIVNLQWTPKDKVSTLKINGRCDEVMKLVMKHLGIEVPTYNRLKDPIFAHATLLLAEEQHTASQPALKKSTAKEEPAATTNGTEPSGANGDMVKKESASADQSEIKIEPTFAHAATSCVSPKQVYLNNLLLAQQHQQLASSYNMLLTSVKRPDARPVLPPLVPCTSSVIPTGVPAQVKTESSDEPEAQHDTPDPKAVGPPVNIIKIDTASNLFGNLRHMLGAINLSNAGTSGSSAAGGTKLDENSSFSGARSPEPIFPLPLLLQPGVTIVQKPSNGPTVAEQNGSNTQQSSLPPRCNKIQLIAVKPMIVSNPPSLVPLQHHNEQTSSPISKANNFDYVPDDDKALAENAAAESDKVASHEQTIEKKSFGEETDIRPDDVTIEEAIASVVATTEQQKEPFTNGNNDCKTADLNAAPDEPIIDLGSEDSWREQAWQLDEEMVQADACGGAMNQTIKTEEAMGLAEKASEKMEVAITTETAFIGHDVAAIGDLLSNDKNDHFQPIAEEAIPGAMSVDHAAEESLPMAPTEKSNAIDTVDEIMADGENGLPLSPVPEAPSGSRSHDKDQSADKSQKMVKVVLSNSALFELYEAAPRLPDRYPPALTLITPIKYQLPAHVIAKMATKAPAVRPVPLGDTHSGPPPANDPSANISSNGLKAGGSPPLHGVGVMPPSVSTASFMPANGTMAAFILKNNSFLTTTNPLYPNLLNFPPGIGANLVFLTSPVKPPATATVGGPSPAQFATPSTSDVNGTAVNGPVNTPVTPTKTFRTDSDEQTDEDDDDRRGRMRRSKRLATARINKQLATPDRKTDSDTDSNDTDRSGDPRRRSNRRRSRDTANESDELTESSYTGGGRRRSTGRRSRSFRVRRKPEFLNIKHPEKKKKRPNEDRTRTPDKDATGGHSRERVEMSTPPAASSCLPGATGMIAANRIFTIASPISYLPASIIAPIGGPSSTAISQQEKYKRILTYCKAAIQQQQQTVTSSTVVPLPQWYDVNYAYSGLHSIIHPPPPNVNLWGGGSTPAKHQPPPTIECKFCFENYSQYACQFYMPQSAKFSVRSFRRGKVVVCECCDFSDDEHEKHNLQAAPALQAPTPETDVEKIPIPSTSKATSSSSSVVDAPERAKRQLAPSKEAKPSVEASVIKRPKCGTGVAAVTRTVNSRTSGGNGVPVATHKPKVKPGWYGKGYRKHLRRKKRTSQG